MKCQCSQCCVLYGKVYEEAMPGGSESVNDKWNRIYFDKSMP